MAGRIEAKYDYVDVKGTPRIRKIRREGKRFQIKSASWQDAKGTWHFVPGVRDEQMAFWVKALYRLPEVVAALRMDLPVWWCEGETDADNLAATGLVATTTPNPSDLWHDQARWFTKYRTQSEVIVVCDQDMHGGWWGWERYTALLRVGVPPSRITVVTPKRRRHNDLSDVLEAGLGVDGLRVVDLGRLEKAAAQYSAARAASYARGRLPPPLGRKGSGS